MIIDNIDNFIKRSMLDKDSARTEVLRAIKNELLVYKTAKNAKPLDDAAETAILNRMVKQRTDSKEQYIAGDRQDLADKEIKEISIISEFLPKKADTADIHTAIYDIIIDNNWGDSTTGPCVPKKSMGNVIKLVKEKLNNVDGKQLADIVKMYLI